MRVEQASAMASAGRSGQTRQLRLPPLWLFGALAVIVLMKAAPQDFGDVFEYHCYALDFWQGAHAANAALALPHHPLACSEKIPDMASQPFKELPREYGPLSMLLFFLPLLAPASWYNTMFSALMCAVVLGVAWMLQRFGPRGAGHVWFLYTLLGTMLVAAGRFDVLPAGLTLVALLAMERRKSLLAYGALAAGTLLKFYPLALLPLLLITSWRRRSEEPLWRGPALFAAIVAVGEGLAALINPLRVLQPLSFMSGRCLEAESFPATLAYLWASVTGGTVGTPLSTVYSSLCQIGPGSDVTPTLTALVGLVALATIVWLYWSERLTLTQGFLFVTGVLVLSAKVFSVQYLLWLSPLVAYAYGVQVGALTAWGLVCLATTLFYPGTISPWTLKYFGLWPAQHSPLFVAPRNLLLLVVGALALRAALRTGAAEDGASDEARAQGAPA